MSFCQSHHKSSTSPKGLAENLSEGNEGNHDEREKRGVPAALNSDVHSLCAGLESMPTLRWRLTRFSPILTGRFGETRRSPEDHQQIHSPDIPAAVLLRSNGIPIVSRFKNRRKTLLESAGRNLSSLTLIVKWNLS